MAISRLADKPATAEMSVRHVPFGAATGDEATSPRQSMIRSFRASREEIAMHPNRKHLTGGAALAVLTALAGCGPEAAPPAPEAPKVTVQRPQPRDLKEHVEFNGWLAPDQVLEVRSRVRGHIHKVHFTDGQMVKKGDLLFELDPRPFQAEIDKVKDQVKIFEAKMFASEKDLVRVKQLVKTGSATQQELDKVDADVKALGAQVAATKNEVTRVELDLEYSKIRSIFAGRIGKAELTEGNLVNAGGSDPLMATVAVIDPIRVYFNVDERALQRYAKSRNVQGKNLTDLLSSLKTTEAPFLFAQDGETEFAHPGKIAFADNRIDPGTGTIQLYGTVANPTGRFLPGARVRVRLETGQPTPSLLVPETAVLADQDKRYVLVVDEKNTVRRRNVILGALTDDGLRAVQPADKLPDGEKPEGWRVVVDNLQRARLNYPADPQEPKSAAAPDKS
jgi:RND family efflux transporter MFP subunit